jgi:uncharacterized delta-60 repeat protein
LELEARWVTAPRKLLQYFLAVFGVMGFVGAADTARAEERSILMRHTAGGAIDPAFPIKIAEDTANHRMRRVVLDSRGRIITCGGIELNGHRQLLVGRSNPDGTPDTSFGWQGITTLPVSMPSEGSACAIATGDKIVVVFSTDPTNWVLSRFNVDGSVDGTFGIGGLSATSHPACTGLFPLDLKIAPDQKIVVAGTCLRPLNRSDFAVARYKPRGEFDTSFSSALLHPDFGGDDTCWSVALHNGSVILAGGTLGGAFGTGMAMARFNTSGVLDASATVDFAGQSGSSAGSVAVDSKDRIVLVGEMTSAATNKMAFAVARLDWFGARDATFSGDGLQTWSPSASVSSGGAAVAIAAGDKIVAGGAAEVAGIRQLALVRFQTNGQLDTTFNGSGFSLKSFHPFASNVLSLALDSQSRLLVLGLRHTP